MTIQICSRGMIHTIISANWPLEFGIRLIYKCERSHTYWGLKNNWGMQSKMCFKTCEGIACSWFYVKEFDVIVHKKYFLSITLLCFCHSVPQLTSELGGWGEDKAWSPDPIDVIRWLYGTELWVHLGSQKSLTTYCCLLCFFPNNPWITSDLWHSHCPSTKWCSSKTSPEHVDMLKSVSDAQRRTKFLYHYSNVIMSAMTSQITSVLRVCSNVCSGTDERKYQGSA